MLVGYFQRVLDSLTLDPLDKDDAAGDVIELPAPMLKVGGRPRAVDQPAVDP